MLGGAAGVMMKAEGMCVPKEPYKRVLLYEKELYYTQKIPAKKLHFTQESPVKEPGKRAR